MRNGTATTSHTYRQHARCGSIGRAPIQRRRPVSASAAPSAIIVTPPPALISSSRRGERPNQARAVPGANAQVPSDRIATITQIAPSEAS